MPVPTYKLDRVYKFSSMGYQKLFNNKTKHKTKLVSAKDLYVCLDYYT